MYRRKPIKLFSIVGVFALVVLLTSQIGFSIVTNQIVISTQGTISGLGSSLSLHVSGKNIENGLGQIVQLRGTNMHGFEDYPGGEWLTSTGDILWGSFDTTAISANLAAMQSGGMNVVRMYSTVQFWVDNTGNHRQNVGTVASLMASRGMYLIYSFWHNNSTDNEPTDLPWNDPGNGYLNSSQDFVNLWSSVASALKSSPNVIFELWNEPQGDPASWFRTAQLTINAIRATGATNLIMVEFGYGLYMDFGYPQLNDGNSMAFINDYPLTDPLGNLIYSTHIYLDGNFYSSVGSNAYQTDYSVADFDCALNYLGVCNATHPIIVGEIGVDMWNTANFANELNWFSGALSLLNEHGIGYCGFWWWPSGEYQTLTGAAGYQPNQVGTLLDQSITG